MHICCAMGALWPTRTGGSKMRPIENFWSRALVGLTVPVGANCDRRPPALRASNSRAFVFVTSARPCSLPSKSAGPLLLSRHFCPDGFFPSEQKRSGSSSNPARLEGSEKNLTLVTEAKARELLMLDDGAFATQRSPASTIEL